LLQRTPTEGSYQQSLFGEFFFIYNVCLSVFGEFFFIYNVCLSVFGEFFFIYNVSLFGEFFFIYNVCLTGRAGRPSKKTWEILGYGFQDMVFRTWDLNFGAWEILGYDFQDIVFRT
jgi:hypothetical protein